jgi:uncharacterized phage infection (PIP) family protein YhgE
MNNDESGRMMASGLSEARSGVAKSQEGLNEFTAGLSDAGLADITTGMDMMTQGMSDMRSATDIMSNQMMTRCTDGGVTMMEPTQAAMDEMTQGRAMCLDNQPDNDADGMVRMKSGVTNMNLALDGLQSAMTCMGHSNMMMGNMM